MSGAPNRQETFPEYLEMRSLSRTDRRMRRRGGRGLRRSGLGKTHPPNEIPPGFERRSNLLPTTKRGNWSRVTAGAPFVARHASRTRPPSSPPPSAWSLSPPRPQRASLIAPPIQGSRSIRMLFHLSIEADNPRHVAGRRRALGGPAPPGSRPAAGSRPATIAAARSPLSARHRDTRSPGDTTRPARVELRRNNATHFAATSSTRTAIAYQREGWPAKYRRRRRLRRHRDFRRRPPDDRGADRGDAARICRGRHHPD